MRIAVLILATLLHSANLYSQVTTFPLAPTQGETVRLQIPLGGLGADRNGHGENYSPAAP